jgi:AcrR family transcriptional regulator
VTRIVKAPDERRSELIAGARKLFYTRGFEKTAVSDIVAEVGVAKGTFYYYFDSKQTVLEAMVDEMVTEALGLLNQVTADETLGAAQKWTVAFEVLNRWKADQKADLLAVGRVLLRPANVRLLHKIRSVAAPLITAELAKIVRQGVSEGVFSPDFVEEAAEICFAIMEVVSNGLREMLLQPERYEDPLPLAHRKVAAAQRAIELVLSASPGSLPIISPGTLEVWFN